MGSGVSAPKPPVTEEMRVSASRLSGTTLRTVGKDGVSVLSIPKSTAGDNVSGKVRMEARAEARTSNPSLVGSVKSGLSRVAESLSGKKAVAGIPEDVQALQQMETLVMGRIAEHMDEHPLVKGRYCLVRDVTIDDERLNTQHEINAPNFNRCKNRYPIFGMGQATVNGVKRCVKAAQDEGFKEIIMVNLREDPVLFSKIGDDFIPYSLRHFKRIEECLVESGRSPKETNAMEVESREEIMYYAKKRTDNAFWFYDDVVLFVDDPHMHHIRYEDELQVTEEVYGRAAFYFPGMRYIRISCPPDGFPIEEEIDALLDLLKEMGGVFAGNLKEIPALMFSDRTGIGAAQTGMVIGYLITAHKLGHMTPESRQKPKLIVDGSDPLENGEYHIIKELVRYLQNGRQIKEEVDKAIDACDRTLNIRLEILETRRELDLNLHDRSKDDARSRVVLFEKFISRLERYYLLILFNSYLHTHFDSYFRIPFSRWLKQQPQLYRNLLMLDMSEHYASPTLLVKEARYLVNDDYPELDQLESKKEYSVPNFRRVMGWPLYGASFSTRDNMLKLHHHLTGEKFGHSRVFWVNLRDDLTLECDGKTYSWRDKSSLQVPVSLPNIVQADIEMKEGDLAAQVKAMESTNVVDIISNPPEKTTFKEVLTCREMVERIRQKTTSLHYYRMPMGNDGAPTEQFFDQVLQLMKRSQDINKNDHSNALVFTCRTGKGRTSTAMAIAGLVYCHIKGFPKGSKMGEETNSENGLYARGEFMAIQRLARILPDGQQVKREVDFVLDQIYETMAPMHFHIREEIFIMYNKMRHYLLEHPDDEFSGVSENTEEELYKAELKKKGLDYLERYFLLICFNAYLHAERDTGWSKSFSTWLPEISNRVKIIDILDDLGFGDFETFLSQQKRIRSRWRPLIKPKLPFRGLLM